MNVIIFCSSSATFLFTQRFFFFQIYPHLEKISNRYKNTFQVVGLLGTKIQNCDDRRFIHALDSKMANVVKWSRFQMIFLRNITLT